MDRFCYRLVPRLTHLNPDIVELGHPLLEKATGLLVDFRCLDEGISLRPWIEYQPSVIE